MLELEKGIPRPLVNHIMEFVDDRVFVDMATIKNKRRLMQQLEGKHVDDEPACFVMPRTANILLDQVLPGTGFRWKCCDAEELGFPMAYQPRCVRKFIERKFSVNCAFERSQVVAATVRAEKMMVEKPILRMKFGYGEQGVMRLAEFLYLSR